MSIARVVCQDGVVREGRICDRYPGGRVEVEDDDGERWTGLPVADVVAASYQPSSKT